MITSKPFYQSKGAMGAIVSLIAGGLTMALKLDPATSSQVSDSLQQIVEVGTMAVTVGGSALALYGRIKATQPLTLGATPAPTPAPAPAASATPPKEG